MSVSLAIGQVVQGIVQGLNSAGQPSGATLSNLSFTIADTTVATGVLDATTPNAIDVTAVGLGASGTGVTTINFTATATDTDGAVSTVSGSDTITVTGTVGPVQTTTGLGITWGTPSAPASSRPGPAAGAQTKR